MALSEDARLRIEFGLLLAMLAIVAIAALL